MVKWGCSGIVRLSQVPKLNSWLISGLVALLAMICWLAAPGGVAWALNTPTADHGARQLSLDSSPKAVPLDDSAETSSAGPLQLWFGKAGSLKVEAFAFLSRNGQRTPTPNRDGVLSLSGMAPIWLGERDDDLARQDQASHYQIEYTTGPLQLRAKLLNVGARFTLSPDSLKQMDSGDAKVVQDAAGTRNLDLNALWNVSRVASLTSSYTTSSNDKPGDKKRGLSTQDMSHVFALALSPASGLRASLNEHDETWDPSLGKMNLQRRVSALEFNTQLGASPGNDLKMALTTTRTKEGENQKSESVREVHLNLKPAPRLQLAADSVAKSTGQGADQTTDSLSATMQLAPNTQLAALVKSLSAESGTRSRETDVKLNAALGGGSTSAKLLAEQKVIRSTDQAQSKQVLNLDLTGGFGTGVSRTNLRAAVLQERGLGPSQPFTRTTKLHADRAVGRRVKLVADREEKLTGADQRIAARIKSAYQMMAELSARSRVVAQLNSETGGDQPDQVARSVAFERQSAAYRLRAQQQLWREGAAKRTATNVAVDLPKGELADWAKDITHGHQFPDAREFMLPKESSWLDMPFSGFRVYSKRFRGGPDNGISSVGWAHRSVIADRLHLEVACQGRPEAEEGDAKGRPMPIRRRLIELGTRVGDRLVAQTRYTGDESVAGPPMRRRDIGFGLRGSLSNQEQLEAMVSHEVNDGADNAKDRTSVTLMYALKAGDDHEVSVKTGCAWTTDATGEQKVEYRWSLGYSKPI